MNGNDLIKNRPELFDGYDGKGRNPEQQSEFDAYSKELLSSAPDYIKQAIADRQKPEQPTA